MALSFYSASQKKTKKKKIFSSKVASHIPVVLKLGIAVPLGSARQFQRDRKEVADS